MENATTVTKELAGEIDRLTHRRDRKNSQVLEQMQTLSYWKDANCPILQYPIPESFGCYTSKGNTILKQHAQKFLEALNAALPDWPNTSWTGQTKAYDAIKKAAKQWVIEWEKLSSKSAYYEEGMSDTAVRECIWAFMEGVLELIDYGDNADDWWNEFRDN